MIGFAISFESNAHLAAICGAGILEGTKRASVVFDYDGQIVRKNGEARQAATPAPTVR